MSENALALLDGALSIEKVIQFRGLIEQSMARVMKEGQHYGKIPGTGEKPTLLQPGAQLLCTLFRLRPEYIIHESTPLDGHVRYRVVCLLFLMGDPPQPIGQGLGEASTMESKHRFRNAAAIVEDTGDPVPPMFWKLKKDEGPEAAKKWLATAYDGASVSVKKFGDEGWRIVKVLGGGDEKVENPNPADQWNTVLKMAKKRAFVDATITATSSSDFFTQDLEDIRDNIEATQRANAAHEGQTAGAAGKLAEAGKAAKEEAPHTGSWKLAVCHIGKKTGPILGKPLGAIDDGKKAWLLQTIQEKEESRRSTADKKLLAALLLWQQEQAGAKRSESPGDGKKTDARAEGNEGVNLEVLASNLDWGDIPTEVFMRVAQHEKWTKAETFGEISDAEATAMVDNIEVVTSRCREEMAGRAATGGQ